MNNSLIFTQFHYERPLLCSLSPQFLLMDLFLQAGTDFAFKQKSEQKVKERNLAGISCVPLKGIGKNIAIKNKN